MSDDLGYMSQAELEQMAQETVQMVLDDMPNALTAEQELIFLTNAGRVMGKACIIMQEMVRDKPKATLQ